MGATTTSTGASAAGVGASATRASGVGANGAVAGPGGNGGGNGGGNDGGALAAFIASPVFSRVAATVPSRVVAGPIFTSRVGLPCQTMTQNIEIDGQDVHASALLCQQPDGSWQIQPTQNASIGNATRSLGPPPLTQ